ncbi:MAG: DNA repair protein RecO [Acidimicrobiia bacterium]|nr:DNA repair protein RecO [Microthrixaceae bacterium]RTL07893.1 MAG: DNA repair protein RecO [Acidimicrobiia bacterium]
MSLYRDSAVVLRTHKLGEADRIVVLMTRESGKVRAVAKGVRRTGSKFGSRLEPGSYAALQLHEGRGELDIVTQAETIESFRRTREDLSRLGRAASLLEAVEQLSEDRQPAPRLHDMLVGGLRTVDERNPPLVTGAFFLKLLAAEGVAPEFDRCVGCGEEDGELALALDVGGVRCRSCGGGRPVTDEALAVARAVLGGGLNVALSLPDGSLTHEVESIATTALELHVERRLRSLQVLHDW